MEYRDILIQEFKERKKYRFEYTLRKYAEDLSLTLSHTHGLLKKQKGLSVARAKKVAPKLGLTCDEVDGFCLFVANKSARSRLKRNIASSQIKSRIVYKNVRLKLKKKYPLVALNFVSEGPKRKILR